METSSILGALTGIGEIAKEAFGEDAVQRRRPSGAVPAAGRPAAGRDPSGPPTS